MRAANSWITYRTRFLVKAKQLTSSLSFIDALGRQHAGRRGDYLVEFSDGVLRILTREFFEDVYVPMFHDRICDDRSADHRINDHRINDHRINDRQIDNRQTPHEDPQINHSGSSSIELPKPASPNFLPHRETLHAAAGGLHRPS